MSPELSFSTRSWLGVSHGPRRPPTLLFHFRFPPPNRRCRRHRWRSRDGARAPWRRPKWPSLERQMPPQFSSPHSHGSLSLPFLMFVRIRKLFVCLFCCFVCWVDLCGFDGFQAYWRSAKLIRVSCVLFDFW